jgi:hypothetical protein
MSQKYYHILLANLRFDWHLLFLWAGFIPARESVKRLLRAGINPAPKSNTRVLPVTLFGDISGK